MEILHIAKGRLKVTLDAEERKEYGIVSFEGGSDLEGELEGVLAVVSAKTGISFKKGKTYVQIYPARDGGCELFFVHHEKEDGALRALVPSRERQSYLCLFEDREETRRFLALLKAQNRTGRVYFRRNEEKYLVLVNEPSGESAFLEEFGRRVIFETAYYLEEHFSSVTL